MRITLAAAGCVPAALEVEPDVSVASLRARVAQEAHLDLLRVKLVSGGRVLLDTDGPARLADGARVLALVAPESRRPAATAVDDEEPEDYVATLRLSQLTLRPATRRLATRFVSTGLPEPLLVLLLKVRARVWAGLALWCVCSRTAARLDLGAPFLVATGFALVFLNLGTRRVGDSSAYSIHNGGRRLLGDGQDTLAAAMRNG